MLRTQKTQRDSKLDRREQNTPKHTHTQQDKNDSTDKEQTQKIASTQTKTNIQACKQASKQANKK